MKPTKTQKTHTNRDVTNSFWIVLKWFKKLVAESKYVVNTRAEELNWRDYPCVLEGGEFTIDDLLGD